MIKKPTKTEPKSRRKALDPKMTEWEVIPPEDGAVQAPAGVRPLGPRCRPRWIPPSLDVIEELAARGLNNEQIGAAFGVSHDTIRNRTLDTPGFHDAVMRGRSRGVANVANAIYENAMKGDTIAQIFFLKAIGKWNDRAGMEIHVKHEFVVALPPMAKDITEWTKQLQNKQETDEKIE